MPSEFVRTKPPLVKDLREKFIEILGEELPANVPALAIEIIADRMLDEVARTTTFDPE